MLKKGMGCASVWKNNCHADFVNSCEVIVINARCSSVIFLYIWIKNSSSHCKCSCFSFPLKSHDSVTWRRSQSWDKCFELTCRPSRQALTVPVETLSSFAMSRTVSRVWLIREHILRPKLTSLGILGRFWSSVMILFSIVNKKWSFVQFCVRNSRKM